MSLTVSLGAPSIRTAHIAPTKGVILLIRGLIDSLRAAPLWIKVATVGGAALTAGALSGAAALVVVDGGSNDGSARQVSQQTPTSAANVQPTPTANWSGSSYSQEGADSPEAALQLMLEGIEENDQDKVLDATDPDFRDEAIGPGNFRLLFQGLFSFFTGADMGPPEISFRDVSLRTEYEEDPEYAVVFFSGRVRALGREESFFEDPTPTVKRNGRWFVTTFDHPYFAAKTERQEATATAIAEAATAVVEATTTAHTELLSISVGKPRLVGPLPDVGGESQPPYLQMAEIDVTFHNGDTAARSVRWMTTSGGSHSGIATCPPGYADAASAYSVLYSGSEHAQPDFSLSLPPGADSTATFRFVVFCEADGTVSGDPIVPPSGAGSTVKGCIVKVDGEYDVGFTGFPECD